MIGDQQLPDRRDQRLVGRQQSGTRFAELGAHQAE
jgi:hypothetical protein